MNIGAWEPWLVWTALLLVSALLGFELIKSLLHVVQSALAGVVVTLASIAIVIAITISAATESVTAQLFAYLAIVGFAAAATGGLLVARHAITVGGRSVTAPVAEALAAEEAGAPHDDSDDLLESDPSEPVLLDDSLEVVEEPAPRPTTVKMVDERAQDQFDETAEIAAISIDDDTTQFAPIADDEPTDPDLPRQGGGTSR